MHSQMMSTTTMVLVSGAILLTLSTVLTAAKSTNTPPLCDAGVIEEMPQHIKKVCMALENSNQLTNALNAYIRNEAAALLYRTEDLSGASGGTGKRTDVDHVFLRFGRRR